jgi:predicted glycosyltransferase
VTNIWIDIINPSHALFFNSLLRELSDHKVIITIRDRAETVELCKSFGINGRVVGADDIHPLKKILSVASRTFNLAVSAPTFDVSMSFENSISQVVSKIRLKSSVLFCDNDLKFSQKKSFVQDAESKVKSFADYVIIPQVCFDNFCKVFDDNKLITYDGCKEDIYIADYKPDPNFLNKVPFENFIVLRPEALASFYVKENNSIVYDLLKAFEKENINVIYLPREKGDISYAKGCKFYKPEKALNGLDLCYYADAVLTGSGTLAREAACIGTTSVSFFPSSKMLSVDQQFVDKKKVLHSRDVDEIVDYVLKKSQKHIRDIGRCKSVKEEVVNSIYRILNETSNTERSKSVKENVVNSVYRS